MKRILLVAFACAIALGVSARTITIKTGIEVLKEQNFKLLEGKRVGLITNPTGVDNRLRSTIDILAEAPNVNLVALFGPEHGVRGDAHAGAYVDNQVDPATDSRNVERNRCVGLRYSGYRLSVVYLHQYDGIGNGGCG